jgi:hypothetical protein
MTESSWIVAYLSMIGVPAARPHQVRSIVIALVTIQKKRIAGLQISDGKPACRARGRSLAS